jgi:DNA-binding NarL/FixJ family response regulator
MIRVFVAAPTRALRLSLRGRLAGPGIEVVGDGSSPDEAPANADVVVITDEDLFVGAARTTTEAGARAVVVLTHDSRLVRPLRGLPLRGWAVVSGDPPPAELRVAVTAAAQGFTVLPATLAAQWLRAPRAEPSASSADPPEPLTPREREVLELLGDGRSNRRIAELLGISEHTAKFHVASVCGKLGASSRTEAVSQGVRRGLITL